MRNTCLLLLSVVICLVVYPLTTNAQATYPFGTIIKRVFDDEKKDGRLVDKLAEKALAGLQPGGTWVDVDYTDNSITNWSPANHLSKIQNIIDAYINPGSSYYKSEKAYQAIVSSFQTWYSKDPKSENWWYNEINVPQRLGVALILMRFAEKDLPSELEQKLLERMKRGDVEQKTAANKTDIATHYFYRALLTEDLGLLSFSLKEFFQPLTLTSEKEGLQHDFSYLQHGPQLYISGYGSVFLSGIVKMAKYVAGTPYALNADQFTLMSEFYLNSYLKTLRSKYIDFNVEGRGISRPNILKKTSEKYLLAAMASVDPDHAAIWKNELLRVDSSTVENYKIKPYHKHFWKGDYVIHVRPDYSFNVRMTSNRTKRSEKGNNENNFGRYLSDGATNIQVRGPEYFNIMPIWEWDKIPGTTSPDHREDLGMDIRWGEQGHNEFAGGVSDGFYGASAYQLEYDSVKAKKAWFFFDEEIVCLGTDIQAENLDPVTTTINQSWLNGNVFTSFGKSLKTDNLTGFETTANSWVMHDGVGYYFPEETSINISTQVQSGNWFKINNSHGKQTLSGNVFKLWIDHGKQSRGAKYSYIVVPAIKNMKSFDAKNIRIIRNEAQNQAVYHASLKILQAVFYQASSVKTDELEVTVDKPCVIMLKGSGSKREVFVADPLQKESNVTLVLRDVKSGKSKTVMTDLPTGEYKGQTKQVSVVF